MILICDIETCFMHIATFKKVLALIESGTMQVRILGTTYKDFTSNLFFLLHWNFLLVSVSDSIRFCIFNLSKVATIFQRLLKEKKKLSNTLWAFLIFSSICN